MTELGMDTNGVTEESLRNLESLKDDKILTMVDIKGGGFPTISVFFFEDDSYYLASGFTIGYGGEGPHGLHQAIRMWYPEELDSDFWNTEISKLDQDNHYVWKPGKGFIEAGRVSNDEESS
jgi:hypothetical protein